MEGERAMKDLGITKGEVFLGDYQFSRNHSIIELFHGIDDIVDNSPYELTHEQVDANARLIIDTFNTAQKCGMLPSELLRQRDELREALIDMVWQFAYEGTKNGEGVMHTGGLSALESAFDALGISDPITVLDFEAAIKNTDG